MSLQSPCRCRDDRFIDVAHEIANLVTSASPSRGFVVLEQHVQAWMREPDPLVHTAACHVGLM